MGKDKIIVKAEMRPPTSKSPQVRVSADSYARICKAAMNCGMTNREMTDYLLSFALSRLVMEPDYLLSFALSRLVMEPVPLFKPGFEEKGEDVVITNDEESQEGLQAICTRVSTGDECQIIIEDGMVAQQGTKTKTTAKPWKEGSF